MVKVPGVISCILNLCFLGLSGMHEHKAACLGHSFNLSPAEIAYVRTSDLSFVCVHVKATPQPFVLVQIVRLATMCSRSSLYGELSAERKHVSPEQRTLFDQDQIYLKHLFGKGIHGVHGLPPGIERMYVLIEHLEESGHEVGSHEQYRHQASQLAERAYKAGVRVFWVQEKQERLDHIIDIIAKKHKWGPWPDAGGQEFLMLFYNKIGETVWIPTFIEEKKMGGLCCLLQ